VAVIHFHYGAAREFNAEMQTPRRQEYYSEHESDQRNDVEHQRVAHKRDIFTDTEKFHFCSLLPAVIRF